MQLLGYERNILDAIINDNLLVLSGKGIGLGNVQCMFLIQTIKASNKPIFILNTPRIEIELLSKKLRQASVTKEGKSNMGYIYIDDSLRGGPDLKSCSSRVIVHDITSDTTSLQRRNIYQQGGVIFATSRILVVDLLNNILNPTQIQGMVINCAHKITAKSPEAFILRLYRLENQRGFGREEDWISD